MHPVENYLKSLSEIHGTGGATAETSYYPALESLLNEVGSKLKPRVRAVSQLANVGAGQPDFGLYTANQFQNTKDKLPIQGIAPERGVIEVKGWSDDSFVTADSRQVSKYWNKYKLVLVTNYRDFVLVGRDDKGEPVQLESHRLSFSERGFRALLAHPRKAALEQGERFLEFLRRVLLYEAALTDPEDLAWFLASYAREARHRVEAAGDLPALAGLKKALEEALGMTFEGEKGEHFFRATLVQTLFYGVFSSWVLWSREHTTQPRAQFDWHTAGWTLHVPMVAGLFHRIASPQQLKPLHVAEVLDWAAAALNRVDRAAFFAKFEEEHAVQYFYEPFLKAYDPELRKELGVWYTPPEIVQYQVERVDRVLREELDIADGLADDKVVILDPCCGTGAYLVETIKRIHKTLEEKGGSALTAQKLKKAVMQRIFGFEILPAPFVVSHLQIGLMLHQLGVPLDHDTDQRAGVYLTNALTGWEPLKEPKNYLPLFHELEQESDAADKVKQDVPILVILGNPPYNAFAGTSPKEEGGLVDTYKEGLTNPIKDGGWGIKKFNLDDLYVRFFRIAERRIAKSGIGVVSYISNFSFLGDPSFLVMRQRFLQEFDKLWFDCMNGDSRETGKLTPDGKPDPSVFSTQQTAVGIRVGTAISLMVRQATRSKSPSVRFQHYWGVTKRQQLLDSLKSKNLDQKYEKATPSEENRYSFRPMLVQGDYSRWPSVLDIPEIPPSNGLMEKRGGALMDFDREALAERMKAYLDSSVQWQELVASGMTLTRNAARYDAKKCRDNLLTAEKYDKEKLKRYSLRPFDTRWCYYSPIRPLWNEPRPSYWAQCWEENACFVTRPTGVAAPEGHPLFYTPLLGDNDFQRGHSYYFPHRLRRIPKKPPAGAEHPVLFDHKDDAPTITANLSKTARAYLAELGVGDPDADVETAGLIWMHALAIGYSPLYLEENADGIRQDWPRIPLPAKKKVLMDSAGLGRRVAALLDTEKPVEGVTCGAIDPRLKSLGVIQKVGGGNLDPDAKELDMTAGWGHGGKDGVCMPGKGKIEERTAQPKQQDRLLGTESLNIYLNDVAYWSNVPSAVWGYTIGGYQVIKKWLSYREKTMLGRGLKMEEAEYVTEMVRRIAALILLQDDLNANYETVKSNVWEWKTRE